ncbi:hypothetical protein [Marinobacter sp.]|uniref:hypothetical protein n=1 Tax=Marinobacter sp. TaxID=50741 RepID=UPI003A912E9D
MNARSIVLNLFYLSPLFSVMYQFRVGETSAYVFDLLFVFILLFFLSRGKVSKSFVAFLICFSLIVFTGFSISALKNDNDSQQFLTVYFRYLQIFLFLGCAFHFLKESPFDDSQFIFKVLIWSSIFPLAYSVVLFYVDPERAIMFGRLAGYFSNPNYLALFIVIQIPIFNYTLSRIRYSTFYNFFSFLVFYCLSLFCLFFTGSISGIALASVAFILSKVFLKELKFVFILGCSGLVVVFLVFLVDPHEIFFVDSDLVAIKRTSNLINFVLGLDESIVVGSGDIRSLLIKFASEIILSDVLIFVFGIGLGQSALVFGKEFGLSLAPHNTYVTFFLEGGFLLVALIVFSGFYFLLRMKKGIRFYSIFIGYGLAMFATPHLYLPFFWCSIGLAMYASLVEDKFFKERLSV